MDHAVIVLIGVLRAVSLLVPVALVTGVVPLMGDNVIGRSCTIVIVDGASGTTGTLSAATSVGTVSQAVTFGRDPACGDAALLQAALILLRLLPPGITGRIFTISL